MRNAVRFFGGLIVVVLTVIILVTLLTATSFANDKHTLNVNAEKNVAQRVVFGKAKVNKNNHIYAVVGDSISAGTQADDTFATPFPTIAGLQSAAYPGRCVTKRCYLWTPMIGDFDVAVDGADWAGVLPMSPRPNTVIFEMGINDLNTGSGSARLIQGLKLVREVGKEMGVRVVFATLIPPGKDAHPFNVLKARRDQTNTWIRKQDAYVDLDKATRNDFGQLRWTYNSGDDVHPNQALSLIHI